MSIGRQPCGHTLRAFCCPAPVSVRPESLAGRSGGSFRRRERRKLAQMSLHRGGVSSFPGPKIPRRPSTARLSGRTLRASSRWQLALILRACRRHTSPCFTSSPRPTGPMMPCWPLSALGCCLSSRKGGRFAAGWLMTPAVPGSAPTRSASVGNIVANSASRTIARPPSPCRSQPTMPACRLATAARIAEEVLRDCNTPPSPSQVLPPAPARHRDAIPPAAQLCPPAQHSAVLLPAPRKRPSRSRDGVGCQPKGWRCHANPARSRGSRAIVTGNGRHGGLGCGPPPAIQPRT